MGFLGLAIAIVAVVSALMPAPGMFVGMGLALLALGLGWVGYRQRETSGWARLSGAAAIAIAVLGLAVSWLRYGMTLWAIEQLDSLL